MSISIYYEVKRSLPLSDSEENQIKKIIEQFSVEEEFEKYVESGDGLNWESFCVYNFDYPDYKSTTEDIIFEGATKLPDNTEDAVWIGVNHWCDLLSQIRLLLSDADWHVHVDGHEIQWDAVNEVFDPTN